MMPFFRVTVLGCWAALSVVLLTLAAPAARAAVDRPAQAQAIMPLAEVRSGMKGYGLTVFHGATIEPFSVEVVSVMRDYGPKRGVIWIRCPDERMQKSGPVQGMSGSPIYLWDAGEEQVLGQGGKLIGAFAYGYTRQVDCYAGVQPIELMRQTGDRVPLENEAPVVADVDTAGAQHSGLNIHDMVAVLDSVGAAAQVGWRARATARFMPGEGRVSAAGGSLAGPHELSGQPQRLLLPLTVCSPAVASATAPLLERLGIAPMAVPGGMLVGSPPAEVNADEVSIQPGSVVSIPLGFGDADLSASGTVTDVLPDGRVLAFGHAMFGEGPAALPMASGFVHYVLASRDVSFKLGGSLLLQGAIVRDENSAVVGTAQGRFDVAPVQVRVNIKGQDSQTYNFHVVNHRALTPVIAALVVFHSVEATQVLPPNNTMRLAATFKFSNGHALTLDSLTPQASQMDVLYGVAPLISAAMDNPFEMLRLEAVDIQVDVEDQRRDARFVNARISRSEVAPGESVELAIDVQPFGAPVHTVRTRFDIPADLPDGEYQVTVSDAQSHVGQLMMLRPHLANVTNIDELLERTQFVLDVPDNAIYVSLLLPTEGVAIGQTELPQLPSSRRAILGSLQRTGVSAYKEAVFQTVPTDCVPQGQVTFPIVVKRR